MQIKIYLPSQEQIAAVADVRVMVIQHPQQGLESVLDEDGPVCMCVLNQSVTCEVEE